MTIEEAEARIDALESKLSDLTSCFGDLLSAVDEMRSPASLGTDLERIRRQMPESY